MTLMHMGLIVIGIKGLARKNLEAKVLIVVYDDRWTDLKSISLSTSIISLSWLFSSPLAFLENILVIRLFLIWSSE